MHSSALMYSLGSTSKLSTSSSTALMLVQDNASHPDLLLQPPVAPFALSAPSRSGSRDSEENGAANLSLTVNYVPSKFSGALLSPTGPRRRKPTVTGVGATGIPRGGGTDAFRSGEARMPDNNDDDYDGVNIARTGWFSKKERGSNRKLRWNMFKTILFFTNTVFFLSTLTTLIFCILTWFDVFQDADVIRVGNRTELIFSTLAAVFGLFTSLIGFAGILLNNRGFLAVYTFFLWITFAFLVIPGYISYKKREFNLEGKLNAQWSRNLGTSGRLRIQNKLTCCGWSSPYVEATISQTCYSRSVLPGCKLGYLNWQRRILKRWYIIAFTLVPVQLGAIFAGLLCSNHVTYRFGKGMMPKRYQLDATAVKVIIDNYKNQIAEQYGMDIASDVIAKSGVQEFTTQENPSFPLLGISPPFESTGESKGEGGAISYARR
ncbi:hypothetical protein GYMLUDRAFT_524373 [Collybiopsis luxurians FD-317 M1]|nr:hypothetical protein GYMLUDRAFT_524373 [Collybiopsis luxurians FD-317 M1]